MMQSTFFNLGDIVQEDDGQLMTAEQLWRSVVNRDDVVQAPEIDKGGVKLVHAFIRLNEAKDTIIMQGASGIHRLSIDASDLQRLHAHWSGFKAVSRSIAVSL